jgi:hypothetical protein
VHSKDAWYSHPSRNLHAYWGQEGGYAPPLCMYGSPSALLYAHAMIDVHLSRCRWIKERRERRGKTRVSILLVKQTERK